MKKLICSLIILISLGMAVQKKQKVIFFGDSITELGIQPGGYIDMLQDLLTGRGASENYNLEGAGKSGDKVYDLYLRLEDDVLSKNPDVVFIWIGVNDVWHKVWGTGTDKDKFEKFYTALIQKIQAKNIQVILVTPAVIGEKYDGSNPMDGDLDSYSEVIRNLSKTYSCGLVDLRSIFLDYEKLHNKENAESGVLTRDKVHLNQAGNRLVAGEILKKL